MHGNAARTVHDKLKVWFAGGWAHEGGVRVLVVVHLDAHPWNGAGAEEVAGVVARRWRSLDRCQVVGEGTGRWRHPKDGHGRVVVVRTRAGI